MLLDTVLARRLPTADELRRAVGPIESGKIVAVCATPKSGSTFLTNVLMRATSRPYLPLCFAYSSNEQDLYLPALVAGSVAGGVVSQLHITGTPHNAELMRLFKIRPIVLTRNLYDSIESLARDLRAKQKHDDFGTGWVGYSFAWLDHNLPAMSDDQLYDFIIDIAVPWYVNFHVSWQRLASQGVVDPVWITYEQLMQDKSGQVRRLLEALGLDASGFNEAFVEQDYLQDAKNIGSDRGVSGRGAEYLKPAQRARVERLLDYYPDLDMGGVGAR